MSKDSVADNFLRSQVRAARELLGLSQKDLSEKLGLSLSAVSRIENGDTQSLSSLYNLKEGLQSLGIRFTQTGIEVVRNTIQLIEGAGCYLKLLDDIFLTLKNAEDKELILMYTSDNVSPPEVNAKYRVMREAGIMMRQLISSDDTYIMGELEEYRTIPKQYFVNIVTAVYADKVAQVSSVEDKIVIHRDAELARREKVIFSYLWGIGGKPTISTSEERF